MSNCCEKEILTGYTPTTAENFQLDSGIFLLDYEVGVDTPATARSKIIGATQGGGSVAFTPTYRDIPIDGLQGANKDAKRILFWDVMMTGNMLEMNTEVFKNALGAVDITTSDFYEEFQARHYICDTDYRGNITFIGTIAGKCDPVIIQLFNSFNNNGLNLTSSDATEGIVPLEFKGHYNPEVPGGVPFKIYLPTRVEAGFVEGIVTEGGEPVEGAEVWIEI